VERVAVIDWDVHHGNDTQVVFYDDPDVLTISLHQDGYYPVDADGSDETGAGRGRGANLNVPLPAGCGHAAYLVAFEEVIVPAVDLFRPELVVVASGYDAAVSDPLGRMLCHSDTYREMTRRVLDLANRHAGGRLVLCQEGGYSPTYTPFCALAVLEELAGVRTPVEDPLLSWYRRLGGQTLQPHQRAFVRAAATLLDRSAADGRLEARP
jgi:acetoin utilization deacetylase AcuC-like enzyme